MPGFSFVAATLTAACDNYIDKTTNFCANLPSQRLPEEEAKAECCPNTANGAQEYCWAETAQAGCDGKTCTCRSNLATPSSGQVYSASRSYDCSGYFSGGKCYYSLPGEMVITGLDYKALEPEPGVNIYVREEKVWFMDSKGYLTSAKVTITVW